MDLLIIILKSHTKPLKPLLNKRMEREDRQKIFNETVLSCENGYYFNRKGEQVIIPLKGDIDIEETTFYDFNVENQIDFDTLPKYNTSIEVINEDCLVAAKILYDDKFTPAVLNMASFKQPGGGVLKGSAAQEENLCRRTNLYQSIFKYHIGQASKFNIKPDDKQYPLPLNNGAIYSPQITVFRGTESDGYPFLDSPFTVDIITSPAIKKPPLDEDGHLAPWVKTVTKGKIRTILNLGIIWNNDSLVLGAYGCGAFGTPPEEMALLFKEVLNEDKYKDKFKKILFAIIDDKNSYKEHNPRGNFVPFKEIIIG